MSENINKHLDWAVIDIETIPNQEIGEIPMPESYVKYGNTKDPAKKKAIYDIATQKWKEEGMNKEMSLNAEYCQVLSIGVITFEAGSHRELSREVYFDEENDKEILLKMRTVLRDHRIIGWNSKGFDLPVIFKRLALLGIPMPFKTYNEITKKYDRERSIDLMHVWNNDGYGKLSDCASAFGIDAKSGMDGSMIYDAYKAVKYEEIREYNMQDCEVCVEICKRLGILRVN